MKIYTTINFELKKIIEKKLKVKEKKFPVFLENKLVLKSKMLLFCLWLKNTSQNHHKEQQHQQFFILKKNHFSCFFSFPSHFFIFFNVADSIALIKKLNMRKEKNKPQNF
jgi:hypothetical protein